MCPLDSEAFLNGSRAVKVVPLPNFESNVTDPLMSSANWFADARTSVSGLSQKRRQLSSHIFADHKPKTAPTILSRYCHIRLPAQNKNTSSKPATPSGIVEAYRNGLNSVGSASAAMPMPVSMI